MKILTIAAALVLLPLVGCDTSTAPTSGDASGADAGSAAEVVEASTTRFVTDLAPYPSTPLPDGLVWETNTEDVPFASPNAKPGGEFRTYMSSFPLTLRWVGPDANGGFANYLRSTTAFLTGIHPNTGRPIPLLATEWAFGPDGRTVYYRLDRNARWSDGTPLTADDFVFTMEMFRSEFIVDPFYNQVFREVVLDVVKHDDYTISIVGATAKPHEELLIEYEFWAFPRHFHKLDANWVKDYDWRIAPSSGPYYISRLEKGQFIEFKRNRDWWGDKNKFLANRYNPDTIRLTVIRDVNVAWEYFLRGEIDSFAVIRPSLWEKAQGELFDKGYIDRIKFYVDVPQPSYGMWLNMDDPMLADRNVRLGLQHSMNIDLLLSGLLRGDYERLRMQFEGYGEYTNPDIQPRRFDLAKANEYFNAAGWTTRGPDGIRVKDGQRLSLSVVYGLGDDTPRLVVLREEAKKAGVELNLQLQDGSGYFKQIQEKKHQIAWMAWSTSPIPDFWQYYHSDNAHIPQTNNTTNIDDPEMDQLTIAFREATDKATRVQLAHRIEQIFHDSAAYIPTYKIPYAREAYWRWLKLPEWYGTRTSDQVLFDPISSQLHSDGLFWIDQEAKADTIAARAEGRTFEPVTIVDETFHVR